MLLRRSLAKPLLVAYLLAMSVAVYELYITYNMLTFAPSIVNTINKYKGDINFIFPRHIDNVSYYYYKLKMMGSTHGIYKGDRIPFDLLMNEKYHQHEFNLFDSQENIEENLDKCSSKLQVETKGISINAAKPFDVDLHDILSKLLKQKRDNRYYREIAPYFEDHLREHISKNEVNKFWFQLAGSSVWLEQYGVYLMIRRIIYSPLGTRNAPLISLSYAQLFNAQWEELHDTHLINPDDDQQTDIEALKFPRFLEIPFYHKYNKREKVNYGPEDPRITTIINSKGHHEPVIIFNALHQKEPEEGQDSDKAVAGGTPGKKLYRSMWICYPFRFQKGKINTDGFDDESYSNAMYNRIFELKIEGQKRQLKQKNWTPFVSYIDRNSQTTRHQIGDTHINFVYRWSDMEIITCELSTAMCKYEYRTSPNLPDNAEVGELRGGTEMSSINELMQSLGIDLKYYIPENREIWVGFARAHIEWCGCGPTTYRPNFVIITRDLVDGKNLYKLSHVSSSISFDIKLKGWALNRPDAVCDGNNILIPNGIASWVIPTNEEGEGKISNDILTLTLSIADLDTVRVNIKNLLTSILKLDNLFLTKDQLPVLQNKKGMVGFNNDNVKCAMESSKKFCNAYGKENGY